MGADIDWANAPEGFPLWLEGTNDDHRKHSGWYREAGLVFEGAGGGQWRAFREGQFFTVHRKPEPAAWDGEGLPPVGVACEVENDIEGGWDAVDEVLAHTEIKGASVAVFKRNDRVFYSPCDAFRPIRTPEQIAAEERKAGILEMIDVFGKDTAIWGLDSVREICGFLYDAGYRKEAP